MVSQPLFRPAAGILGTEDAGRCPPHPPFFPFGKRSPPPCSTPFTFAVWSEYYGRALRNSACSVPARAFRQAAVCLRRSQCPTDLHHHNLHGPAAYHRAIHDGNGCPCLPGHFCSDVLLFPPGKSRINSWPEYVLKKRQAIQKRRTGPSAVRLFCFVKSAAWRQFYFFRFIPAALSVAAQ